MRTREENVAIGRAKKAVGDAFESWVEGQHEMAIRLGILAHAVHNQPTSRMIKGRLSYAAATVADYTGCLEGRIGETGGRLPAQYLAVEAKSTADDCLYRSAISLQQQRHLEAVARAGGLALLIVEYRRSDSSGGPLFRRFSVPWLDVPWRVLRSVESAGVDDMRAEWLVEPGDCYLKKYHPGGPRSSAGIVGAAGGLRRRVFPRE